MGPHFQIWYRIGMYWGPTLGGLTATLGQEEMHVLAVGQVLLQMLSAAVEKASPASSLGAQEATIWT